MKKTKGWKNYKTNWRNRKLNHY